MKSVSLEWSPDVWNQNGSELEGHGFDWCVVPPHVVVSLISEDRGHVGDDFVIIDKSWTRMTKSKIQVVEQEKDLRG